jgi:hypothetical protein
MEEVPHVGRAVLAREEQADVPGVLQELGYEAERAGLPRLLHDPEAYFPPPRAGVRRPLDGRRGHLDRTARVALDEVRDRVVDGESEHDALRLLRNEREEGLDGRESRGPLDDPGLLHHDRLEGLEPQAAVLGPLEELVGSAEEHVGAIG